MLEIVSFATFFLVNKHRLNKDHLLFLNPETQTFYKDNDMWYGLAFNKDNVEITCAVGYGLKKSFINLTKETLKLGIKKIRFTTYSDHPTVNAYAKLGNCIETGRIEKFYESGKDAISYECDIEASQEILNKAEEGLK